LAVRIDGVALGVIAGAAVRAEAAGDGRRNDDPVADIEVAHARAQPLDHPAPFVAQDGARLDALHGAADEVQVGAADGAGSQADDGIGLVLQGRLRHVVQPDIADAVEYNRFHDALSCGSPAGAIAWRQSRSTAGQAMGASVGSKVHARRDGGRAAAAAGARRAGDYFWGL